MAAKSFQISPDAGTNWFTFPGNSGEFNSEGTNIDDTIFGASYRSGQSGMITWTMNANGLYKGFAGYVADLLITGTPVVMTDEATALVSGKTYQITNTAHRIMDPETVVVVEDGGVAVSAANILNLDYLWGMVTFVGSYTPSGAITITGAYLPTQTVARANGFTLTQTMEAVDDSDYENAQATDGHRVYINGLKTVELSLTGIWNSANDWRARLISREVVVIQINPDGNLKSVARGFFRPTTVNQSGDVGAQEEANATWPLYVPDIEKLKAPFSWTHAVDTTLNASIRHALTAYQDNLVYDYRYLADGVNGYTGEGIVVDLTLTGGLDVMHEFTVNIQGSGQLTAVP